MGEPTNEAEWTDSQRQAISAEARCVLSHPSFRNSRRCVSLLQSLIDHALAGTLHEIKERTLGAEVFGREPTYDTSADPIVRMTANEIRKRLAQCYQESDRSVQVRIRLVPGTYLPTFDFRRVDDALNGQTATGTARTSSLQALVADDPHDGRKAKQLRSSHNRTSYFAAIGLLCVPIVGALAMSFFDHSTQKGLWEPLLNSEEATLVCVPDVSDFDAEAGWATVVHQEISEQGTMRVASTRPRMPLVPFVDAAVAATLANWLGVHRSQTTVRLSNVLTLSDLRRSPVVLIGAFDNPWSLALLSKLRYHVQVDPVTEEEWIEDSQNPGNRSWRGSGKLLYSDSSVDYAIVSRFQSPDTGQWIVAAGGLGMHGTEAAGELLTTPAFARALPKVAASGKNLQFVLRTNVIDGHTGPPEIVAVYAW